MGSRAGVMVIAIAGIGVLGLDVTWDREHQQYFTAAKTVSSGCMVFGLERRRQIELICKTRVGINLSAS